MAEPRETSPQELVRRALEAAEIADGCYDPKIRESFFSLAELRLQEAQAAFDGDDKTEEAEPAKH